MGRQGWGSGLRERLRGMALAACLLPATPASPAPPAFQVARWRPRPGIDLPDGTRLAARVVGVTDGDTVKAYAPGLPEIRVRLLGIDAPEMGQDYGKVARQVLADLVLGREVILHTHGNDRYGRLLAKILVAGKDVNLALVHEGLAWHYARYASTQFPGDAARYAEAQAAAHASRTGLWSFPHPVPPWDWRRKRR